MWGACRGGGQVGLNQELVLRPGACCLGRGQPTGGPGGWGWPLDLAPDQQVRLGWLAGSAPRGGMTRIMVPRALLWGFCPGGGESWWQVGSGAKGKGVLMGGSWAGRRRAPCAQAGVGSPCRKPRSARATAAMGVPQGDGGDTGGWAAS